MKMQRINQWLPVAAAALFLFFAACENMMDVHHEFIRDGEIIYAPKVDSFLFLSGKERAVFRGWLKNSPNVKTVDFYWNNGKDSLIVPVSPDYGIYPMEAVLPLREEKAYTFDVRTTDLNGHHSLKQSGFATSYGSIYQSTLFNRNVREMSVTDQGGEINWMLAPENLVRSEVRYTDANDEVRVIHVLPNESTTVCPVPKEGATVETRSLYLPEAAAVDTFSVAWTSISYKYTGMVAKSDCSIASFSDEHPTDGGGVGALIDGDLSNFWHSDWRSPAAPLPHWAIIDMTSPRNIIRIDTYRRPGNNATNTVTYYVSDDPDPDADSWVEIASGSTWNGDYLRLDIAADKLEVAKGQYLKIYLPDSNNYPFTSVSEIDVYEVR